MRAEALAGPGRGREDEPALVWLSPSSFVGALQKEECWLAPALWVSVSLPGGLMLACHLEVVPNAFSQKPLPSSRQNWDAARGQEMDTWLVSRVWRCTCEAGSSSPHSSWMKTRSGRCGPDWLLDLPTLESAGVRTWPPPGALGRKAGCCVFSDHGTQKEESWFTTPWGWTLSCHRFPTIQVTIGLLWANEDSGAPFLAVAAGRGGRGTQDFGQWG